MHFSDAPRNRQPETGAARAILPARQLSRVQPKESLEAALERADHGIRRRLLRLASGTTPDHTLVTTLRLLCIQAYCVIRGEPRLTATAALGKAGLNASMALLAAIPCVAAWLLGFQAESGLPGIALGLALYSLTVPVLVAFSPGSSLPSPRPHPADLVFFALSLCLLAKDLPL